MLEVRNYKKKKLYDMNVSKENSVEIKELKKGEKASILDVHYRGIIDFLDEFVFIKRLFLPFKVIIITCHLSFSFHLFLFLYRLHLIVRLYGAAGFVSYLVRKVAGL